MTDFFFIVRLQNFYFVEKYAKHFFYIGFSQVELYGRKKVFLISTCSALNINFTKKNIDQPLRFRFFKCIHLQKKKQSSAKWQLNFYG